MQVDNTHHLIAQKIKPSNECSVATDGRASAWSPNKDAAQYWHTWMLLLMLSDKESDTCSLCLQLCKSLSCTARTGLRARIKTGLRAPNEHTMVGLHGNRFSCLKLCTKTTNELHSLALKRKLDRLTTNGFARPASLPTDKPSEDVRPTECKRPKLL